MKYSAGFGPGAEKSIYRYTLRRDWTDEPGLFNSMKKNCVLFLMLNPSVADMRKDDNTVSKCMRLARTWGYGAIEVRNIFALRSTDPRGLKAVADPVGPENDKAIIDCASSQETGLIIAAWGNHGSYLQRSSQVRQILQQIGKPVFAFGITSQNEPAHPLYQKECQEADLVRFM
jgi:hypothetical protein